MGTVADEIAFSLENLGIDPSTTVERVREAANLCGVDGLLTEKLTELSSGQKQRVALAAAIACRPRILVLDEPTSNLDRAGSEGLVGILARLKEEGVAIVVSEHRLHRFLPVADQFVCMRSGRIAARWSAGEFATLSNDDVAEFGLRHPGMRIEKRDEPKADVPAWRLEEATYVYPSTKRGIRQVSAEFPLGAVTVVRGGNGTGKTTLAKVLVGAAREQRGCVMGCRSTTPATPWRCSTRMPGELLKVYVFAACLPYSGMLYAEGFFNMREESWVEAHVHTFSFFGDGMLVLVPDNLKQVVARSNGEFDIVSHDVLGCVFYEAKFRKTPISASTAEKEIEQVREAGLDCRRDGFFSRSGSTVEHRPGIVPIDLPQLYE